MYTIENYSSKILERNLALFYLYNKIKLYSGLPFVNRTHYKK